MARNALGRGLGALSRELEGKKSEPAPAPPQPQTTAPGSAAAAMPARQPVQGGPQEIDIDLIEPSPYQPRTKFHEQALDELARSIKTSGIIQPLVVRPIGNKFQLIAGERRWRAAQRAGRGALTVRQIEKLAARRAQGKQLQPPSPPQLDPNMRSALEELQRHLGTRIILRLKTKVRPGQLVLEFYDDAQLMGLYDRLMK